ncbi:MAG: hypothetical protein KAQ88_11495 [Hyphomicrobiaceae bacterium]|nr:hypothetical protein [Hyphomicrobiaceae bacterium]
MCLRYGAVVLEARYGGVVAKARGRLMLKARLGRVVLEARAPRGFIARGIARAHGPYRRPFGRLALR